MVRSLTRPNEGARCSVCNSLGYGAKRDRDTPSLTTLADRSFDDFKLSALQGCSFCDLTLQSFMLLQYVDTTTPVELLFYSNSPTELHSLADRDVYDVVEIYPCSGELRHLYIVSYGQL